MSLADWKRKVNNDFAPKLSFNDRCFVLCLHFEGHEWSKIASFFNIHRRTAEMVRYGPHYKNVREEAERLGQADFISTYLDHEKYESYRVYEAGLSKEQLSATARKQQRDPNEPGWNPNKTAKSRGGEQRAINPTTGLPTIVNIEWRNAADEQKPGWYWYIGTEASDRPYATSTEAFEHSRRIWDFANSPEGKEREENDAATRTAIERAKEAAAEARAYMEREPTQARVDAFVRFFTNALRLMGDDEATIADSLRLRANWRGFDPTPFGYELGDA